MEKQSVLQKMNKKHKYLVKDIFFVYFSMGIYLMLIGSALPSIKSEYHISYQIGGLMMTVQQIGYLTVGLLIGVIAGKLGAKRTWLGIEILAMFGLLMIVFVGNPWILLFSMLLTGISKGSNATIGNQIVSNLSASDTGLLNLSQAFFALGACTAPLIALVCGASWRTSFAVCIAIGLAAFLHGVRTQIGQEAFVQEKKTKPDFGFFRQKIFWLCAVILLCYLSIEACFMGWMVTYFIDSGTVNEQTAQLLATVLWAAVLVGRFGSAYLSKRFQPQHMILVMTLGVILCFTMMMFGKMLPLMVVGTMGMGLFMAGMYGTTFGGCDNLLERYPLCMGMFIAIPGIGAAVTPGVVGMLSDRIGIRNGMLFLYVLIAVLLITSILFVLYHKKKK